MRVTIFGTAWNSIVCGSLLLEMMYKRVERQEGGKARAVVTVYIQQLDAVVTHGDARLSAEQRCLCWKSSSPSRKPLHGLVSALGRRKLVEGQESIGIVHCWWTEFEVSAAVKTS